MFIDDFVRVIHSLTEGWGKMGEKGVEKGKSEIFRIFHQKTVKKQRQRQK